ncbi:hypothetical protein WG66_007675 [Moniliophthora roreri]|nr:hypothetical protein WG66_007675 [Moniliophthora roreri]
MAIEYVYALHDFVPENDDEVPFKAGEPIEVIEKDELYGDGWWQGRNLAGKVGLFPEGYTTAVPPVPPIPPEALAKTVSMSSTVKGEDATGKDAFPSSSTGAERPESSSSAQLPSIYINGHQTEGSHSQEMQATMTDVQQAIEQLGRGGRGTSFDEGEDRDGGRSFSFASSRGDGETDRDTDTDLEMSDVDQQGEDGEGWHKGAREKLAEKARRAIEEAEKLESMMGGGSSSNRYSAPPIEVEMSDESEGEGDEDFTTKSSSFFRRHSRIPEVDEEEEEQAVPKVTAAQDDDNNITVPEREETDAQTATATQTSFPSVGPPPTSQTASSSSATQTPVQPSSPAPESLKRNSEPLSVPSPSTSSIFTGSGVPPPGLGIDDSTQGATIPGSPSKVFSPSPANAASASPRTSLPQPSSPPPLANSASNASPFPSAPSSVFASEITASPSSPFQSTTSPTVTTAPTSSAPPSTISETVESSQQLPADPATWTLQNVLAWLQQRGFDETVQERFIEQEITGDVLLELDVQVLKTEIGIMAFGKRARIIAAIGDLKRSVGLGSDTGSPVGPGSIGSPAGISPHFHQSPSFSPGGIPQSPHSVGSLTHSRTHSQSQQSARSFPGSAADLSAILGVEGFGLGIHQNGNGIANGKSRPANLSLSPNDVNEDVEKEALSENDAPPTTSSSRRRFFGRSVDSTGSRASGSRSPAPDRNSTGEVKDGNEDTKDKDGSSIATTSTGRHARAKKSIDNGRGGGERLSIFGSTFAPSLGKHRKPAPRYSRQVIGEDGLLLSSEKDKEKSGSTFHMPRLTGGRKSSGRPGSSSGLKEKNKAEHPPTKEKSEARPGSSSDRDPQLLRKRTSSYPGPNNKEKAVLLADEDDSQRKRNVGEDDVTKNPLKPGQNVLEQIGEPDHSGWMRKKGDRYNSWKLRYFVLKGPHLYYLRSNSSSETKIKGYIHIVGYKVTVDENVNPGKYGFRIDHDNDKTHFFSSDEKTSLREWMKAIMKATIGRDYTRPVVSSCNIPTIPLMVAQAMNPSPRPPSPTARDATQKALRRENPNQLSSRDARVLMGLPNPDDSKDQRERLETFFNFDGVSTDTNGAAREMANYLTPAPPRPSREARRGSVSTTAVNNVPVDDGLIEWANSCLPSSLQITDTTGSICGGLTLLRLAEAIKGRPSSPPVPDSAFPSDTNDDKLEGLFKLFDFLLDNDVKMGSVSINDIRQGKRDKIIQLLKALKAWEDKRKAIVNSIGKGSVHAGGFMAPVNSPMSSLY